MKQIRRVTSLSTKLLQEFDAVVSIEMEDKAFSSGGFGEVYHCKTINGNQVTTTPQVIKIFIDNKSGSAADGFKTIQALQRKLTTENLEDIKKGGNGILHTFPALLGCPQFSFKGELDGVEVMGYSANNLVSLGFTEFKEILSEPKLLTNYNTISWQDKMKIAYHLVAGFDLLKKCLYIHADFKDEALFVNVKTYQCAIIDYDSGAVMQNEQDKPSTFGTLQEWLAPEISRQLGQNRGNKPVKVSVDLFSDVWSVNMCVHTILFSFPPLFFLSEISDRSVSDYSNNYTFPDLDKNSFPFYKGKKDAAVNQLYDWYLKKFKNELEVGIKKKIQTTAINGYENKGMRTSYAQWKMELSVSQKPPQILNFYADVTHLQTKQPVSVAWSIDNASAIFLNGKDLTGRKQEVLIIRRDTVLELIARNSIGEDRRLIQITVSKNKPIIYFFKGDRTMVDSLQDKITFSWKAENYETLILEGIGDVSKSNTVVVNAPKVETVFRLTATTFFGVQVYMEFGVKVSQKPPEITEFKAVPQKLTNPIGKIILHWDVKNADSVLISNGIGSVLVRGQREVVPRSSSLYILTAVSPFGVKSSQTVFLQVDVPPPSIKQFKADISFVKEKKPIKLRWEIDAAETVVIDNGVGNVTAKGEVSVVPERDTRYKIVATSYFGGVSEAHLSVMVSKTPPTIVLFQLSENEVIDDKPIKMEWEVKGSESVTISGIGKVPAVGHSYITILSDAEFVIRAFSSFGYISERKISIRVSKRPPIVEYFTVVPKYPQKGKPCKIRWRVTGANKIFINEGIGKVEAEGEREILFKNELVLLITAVSFFGIENQVSLTLKVVEPAKLQLPQSLNKISNKLSEPQKLNQPKVKLIDLLKKHSKNK